MKTVLLYDSYFEEMESLFRHLDTKKLGKIQTKDLLEAVDKLRGEEISALHELRVPSSDDLEIILGA